MPQAGVKGRPVSSFDEVRAMSIDFDGSVFYFPDLSNKRIYTKQIQVDGTPGYNVYELKEMSMNEMMGGSSTANLNETFITRQEFEQTIQQFKEVLQNMANKTAEVQPEPIAQTQPPQEQKPLVLNF